MSLSDDIDQMFGFLVENGFPKAADTAVILGSGLGGFEIGLLDSRTIAYNKIPGFPRTSVAGHPGTLSTGILGSKSVLVFAGRFHHYEGFTLEETAIPVRLAHAFGIHTLIATNASGGINAQYQVGDLMLIEDVISLGCRFIIEPSKIWKRFGNDDAGAVQDIALKSNISIQRGTYLFVKGPSYETKAEIRAFRRIGADAVGMSTVPELVEASRLNIRSIGISLITNKAAGMGKTKLTHDEIRKVAGGINRDLTRLLHSLIESW